MEKKYKLEDLKLGMRVESDNLSEIKDTHIILTEAQYISGINMSGKISFIGQELTDEARDLYKPGVSIYDVYNDSLEEDEELEYDE